MFRETALWVSSRPTWLLEQDLSGRPAEPGSWRANVPLSLVESRSLSGVCVMR